VLMNIHDVDEAVLLSDRIVMMTNGPAGRTGEVLDVPLARPRRRLELASNPIYLKCWQRMLEFLYERPSLHRSNLTHSARIRWHDPASPASTIMTKI
jgi:nitrate/nitrite transport system ATP-binding protein